MARHNQDTFKYTILSRQGKIDMPSPKAKKNIMLRSIKERNAYGTRDGPGGKVF